MNVTRLFKRALLAALVSSAALALACGGFYEGAFTPTPGPSPTPGQPVQGDPADIAVRAAKAALSAKLGLDATAFDLVSITGATWRRASPGCYPLPVDFKDEYLLPGMRLSLMNTRDGVVYEYDADLPGTTGRVCDSTAQPVEVVSAANAVPDPAAPLAAGRVVVLLTEEEAASFSAEAAKTGPGFAVLPDRVDWDTEAVAGASVMADPAHPPVVLGAEWDVKSNTVTVRVMPGPGSGNILELVNVWILVDKARAGSAFMFEVVSAPGEMQTPAAPVSATPTPGRIF